MEYIRNGDLHTYLLDKTTLAESEARVIASQLLEGLQEMHKHGFAYRDLKPQVLIS
jgi:serine/threonine protein kinase